MSQAALIRAASARGGGCRGTDRPADYALTSLNPYLPLAPCPRFPDYRVMPGQTLSEIRQLLAGAELSPQHRFGQNFLIDLNLMRKLVQEAELCAADTVLEVGPGTGSLTEFVLESGAYVVSVEIDHGLQSILRTRLGDHPRFTLVQGDALAGKHRVNPLVLKPLVEHPPGDGGAIKLVANLPYQIATPLLVDLLQVEPRFERLVCTIQKEVGERLVASPRESAYGTVSVITQTLARVHPIAILPPSAFWPRPEVQSVMVHIEPLSPDAIEVEDISGFSTFVQQGFQQRRKMLRRLFRDWDEEIAAEVFQRAGVSPNARPEELSPGVWRRLYRTVRAAQNH